MDIRFVNQDLSAEDRAIIILSINFSLAGEEHPDHAFLNHTLEVLFHKYPFVPCSDYPTILHVVRVFYSNLLSEGEAAHFSLRGRNVFSEVSQKCADLISKLEYRCDVFGLSTNPS